MSGKNVYWIFGRGASISCNLRWDMPEMNGLSRDKKISRICSDLKNEQEKEEINTDVYNCLLNFLGKNTNIKDGWKHTFSALNWDTLFERAIVERNWKVVPKWLTSSMVYHWNGSIETGQSCATTESGLLLRSPFVLPDDLPESRKTKSIEGNYAFNKMGWTHALVICGVSFGNKCDETLIHLIKWVHDELPIGECHCIIVNPCKSALDQISQYLQEYMWREMKLVKNGIIEWIDQQCPELYKIGALARENFAEAYAQGNIS